MSNLANLIRSSSLPLESSSPNNNQELDHQHGFVINTVFLDLWSQDTFSTEIKSVTKSVPNQCTILYTSNDMICYSVKDGKMLRVIDSINGNKLLVKNENVMNQLLIIKNSNNYCICSTEEGIYIYMIKEEITCILKINCRSKLLTLLMDGFSFISNNKIYKYSIDDILSNNNNNEMKIVTLNDLENPKDTNTNENITYLSCYNSRLSLQALTQYVYSTESGDVYFSSNNGISTPIKTFNNGVSSVHFILGRMDTILVVDTNRLNYSIWFNLNNTWTEVSKLSLNSNSKIAPNGIEVAALCMDPSGQYVAISYTPSPLQSNDVHSGIAFIKFQVFEQKPRFAYVSVLGTSNPVSKMHLINAPSTSESSDSASYELYVQLVKSTDFSIQYFVFNADTIYRHVHDHEFTNITKSVSPPRLEVVKPVPVVPVAVKEPEFKPNPVATLVVDRLVSSADKPKDFLLAKLMAQSKLNEESKVPYIQTTPIAVNDSEAIAKIAENRKAQSEAFIAQVKEQNSDNSVVTVQELGPDHPEYASLSKMHVAITNNHTPLAGSIKKFVTKPKVEITSADLKKLETVLNVETPLKSEIAPEDKNVLFLDNNTLSAASVDTFKGLPVTPLEASKAAIREKAEGSILSRIDKQVQSQFTIFIQKFLAINQEIIDSHRRSDGNQDTSAFLSKVQSQLVSTLVKSLPELKDAQLEAATSAITKTINSKVESELKHWFATGFIPTFEKSTQVMFEQIQEALLELITNSIKSLSDQVASTNKKVSKRESVITSASSSHDFSAVLEAIKELKDQNAVLINQNTQLNMQLVSLSRKVEEQSVLISNMSSGPKSSNDSFDELKSLVLNSNFAQAIEYALQAKNTFSLMWLCNSVPPSVLKGKSGSRQTLCAQNVLLSLIQQLSIVIKECDDDSLNAALSWMKDALFAVKPTDSLISSKYCEIITEVNQALEICDEKYSAATDIQSIIADIQNIIELHLSFF